MPNVGGKFFPYSKEGMAAAKKAEAKLKADAMLKSKAKPKDKNKKMVKPKAKAKVKKVVKPKQACLITVDKIERPGKPDLYEANESNDTFSSTKMREVLGWVQNKLEE